MLKRIKGPLLLMLCAIFWGSAFSAQSSAMDHVGPYTFVCMRSAITCFVLTGFLLLTRSLRKKDEHPQASMGRHLLIGGLCGLFLVLASILQQVGIVTTTTAKSGFITALYIVMVPIFSIALKQKPAFTLWIGVLVSLCGLYFLCMRPDELNVNIGDLYTFACAIVFALHIMLIDRMGNALDSVVLSAVQFGTAAIVSCAVMLIFEDPSLPSIQACLGDILFAALLSGVLGYTLQIVGQKHTEPTLASIIMCLESVFAALFGWILLGETLSGREMLGCGLMLAASVIALIPIKKMNGDIA